MSILSLLILALRFYLLTVAVTLLLEMLVTLRSQIHGIPLKDDQLIITIISAILPLANLVMVIDNLSMLFNGKNKFILRYMYVRDRLDELERLCNKEDDEED